MRNNIKLLLKLIIPYSIFIIVVSAIVFMIFSNIYKNDYLEQLYIDINRISSSIEKDINNIKLVLNILDSYMVADLTPYELGLSMTNGNEWEERTGLHCSSFQIRDMKTRWGTCNTRTGKLWFALMLARQPRECVEYVVLHELAHLYEPSHNARFKAFLDVYMPGWREIRKSMR